MERDDTDDLLVTGGPTLCSCGKPMIRAVMGKQGEWYVGRWCGCDDSDSPRFSTYEEAEAELFR